MTAQRRPGGSPRRQRLRRATEAEIKTTARRLLVESGAKGLTVRAIAREMGLTAPALYRYFPGREDLVEHVIADLYDEVTGAVIDALAQARAAGPADAGGPMLAVSRAFRRWALDHPQEFGLLFGSPAPGDPGAAGSEGPAGAAAQRFRQVFGGLIAELHERRPLPVEPDGLIDAETADRLREWCENDFAAPLPLGVLQVFLSCWIRLYGVVCLEVFGHLRFALTEAEPMFEAELRSLATLLGVPDAYRPPAGLPAGA